MRIQPGSEKAWKVLVGAPWPLLDPAKPKDGQRVQDWLQSYWSERLSRVRSLILAAPTRDYFLETSEGVTPDRLHAGYEMVSACGQFQAHGLWFMDLGALAWAAALREVRDLYPALPKKEDALLKEVEKLWRSPGPEAAAARLKEIMEQPLKGRELFNLYRAPLALWQERDLDLAARSLDTGLTGSSLQITDTLGCNVVLTYALIRAMKGAPEEAAEMLERSVLDHAYLWSEEALRECLYHRARYLWLAGMDEAATQSVIPLIREQPAYLLRFATDVSWGKHPEEVVSVYEQLSQMAEEARAFMIRWQRAVPAPAEGEDPFRFARSLLRISATDIYPLFAALAARGLALEAGAVEPYRPPQSFYNDVRELKECLAVFPVHLPFRRLPTVTVPFVGVGVTETAILNERLELNEVDRNVVEFVSSIMATLPGMSRMFLYEHGKRLVDALTSAAEFYDATGKQARAQRLVKLLEECFTLPEKISSLPTSVGRDLGRSVAEIWKIFSRVEHQWGGFRVSAHGQLLLDVATEEMEIPLSRWGTLQFTVRDMDGAPVPGMPVVWKVTEGPAEPKDEVQCLTEHWALTFQAGGGYISLKPTSEAQIGQRGSIALWLHGSSAEVVRVPFVITA